jgi:hypothetical protein
MPGAIWRRIRFGRFCGRPHQQGGPARKSTPRPVSPCLEVLEDRTAPAVHITYQGGLTIPHVQVNNVVMGSQPINTTALMQALVKDYLPLLRPYYGIGAGSLRSSINLAPLAGNPTDAQVRNLLAQDISAGALPAPDDSQAYFVFLAPGQTISGPPGPVASYHSSFPMSLHGTPVLVNYALITGPYSNSVAVSHELAEVVTDPEAPTGYIDLNLGGGGEVADIYAGSMPPFLLDGYQVAVLSGPAGQVIALHPGAPGQPPSTQPPSLFQAAMTLFLDGMYAILYWYQGNARGLADVNASITANLPYAGPFAPYFVFAGETAMLGALSGDSGP